jgi:hypothetical protein
MIAFKFNISRPFSYFAIFPVAAFLCQCNPAKNVAAHTSFYKAGDFDAIHKYDTHVHLNVYDTSLVSQAKTDNFRLLTVNVGPAYYPAIEEQQSIATQLVKDYPRQLAYATTFSLENFDSEQWQQKALDYLKTSFLNGAIAVKVWKDVGMELRDKDGKFVMIDHP